MNEMYELGFEDWYDYEYYMTTGDLPDGYVWDETETHVEYIGEEAVAERLAEEEWREEEEGFKDGFESLTAYREYKTTGKLPHGYVLNDAGTSQSFRLKGGRMDILAEKLGIESVDMEAYSELRNVYQPLILFRGKPITREQTMQLITGEEPLFYVSEETRLLYDMFCYPRGVLDNIFYRPKYPELSTWVYSDGTIGGSWICQTANDKPEDYLPKYLHLAEKYPFLDMVISFTDKNECCCFECEPYDDEYIYGCRCLDCDHYLDGMKCYFEKYRNYDPFDFEGIYYKGWRESHVWSDIGNYVHLTIWIHNGKTEILFEAEARAKFNEYNDLYCAPEYAFMFGPSLYAYHRTCIFDQKFVEDCFEYIGKPRTSWVEYVNKNIILPFNEKAIVVTKDWVVNQYNKFIAPKVK